MERDGSERLQSLNERRRSLDPKKENFGLTQEERNSIASPAFKEWSKGQIQQKAARSRMVVFIGSGDLSSKIIKALKEIDESVVTVAIDTKISVASTRSDYLLLVDEKQGLWNEEILIGLLRDIFPKQSGMSRFRKHMKRLAKRTAASRLAPVLIGDYHGFDAKHIFQTAEKLGYHVMPDTTSAIQAMDKIAFWQAYHAHPTLGRHLLPQEAIQLPYRAVDILLSTKGKALPGDVQTLLEETKQKVNTIGLPCMLKPAISEFGYGQVKLDDLSQLQNALNVAAEQCRKYLVNPGYRLVIEPFAVRRSTERVAKGRPVELMQIVARHRDTHGRLVSTCLPPIWFINHLPRPYERTGLIAGPQVFDYAVQAPASDLPEILSTEQYNAICQTSKELVESMTQAPGLFGLEIFLLTNGEFKFNRVSVRTQDTMPATTATQQIDAFSLMAKIIQNERIDPDLLIQRHSGGVKAIVWEGDVYWSEHEEAKILGLKVNDEAVEALKKRGYECCQIDLYYEKKELRPLRRYGLICIRGPLDRPLSEVRDVMEQADGLVQIIHTVRPRGR
jgi:hypothetical protein